MAEHRIYHSLPLQRTAVVVVVVMVKLRWLVSTRAAENDVVR
jgi:hypothetical protein